MGVLVQEVDRRIQKRRFFFTMQYTPHKPAMDSHIIYGEKGWKLKFFFLVRLSRSNLFHRCDWLEMTGVDLVCLFSVDSLVVRERYIFYVILQGACNTSFL